MQKKGSNKNFINKKLDTQDILKIPPHSVEAEQALLGGIIVNLKSWNKISNYITEHDFYRKEHKKIYKIISLLMLNDKIIDIITIKDKLENEEVMKDIGGVNYLINLSRNLPTSANIITYAEIIKEKSLLRKLIRIGEKMVYNAFHPKGKTGKIILDEVEYLV